MGTLFAHQSMPREKRAPPGYLEYSLNGKFTCAASKHEDSVGSASSATVDIFSDSSSRLSWRPTNSQSSAHTTPDSTSSYGHSRQPEITSLEVLPAAVQSVDVPSWREGVEKENQSSISVPTPCQRPNSRRTGPVFRITDPQHVSPPSTLVRQPERRQCFVSSLVLFAAGLIAAIWPLSAPVLHDVSYAHNVLPLQDFITETLRRSKTSYSTLQVAMYYLVLLKEHLPKCDFTQEQSCILADRRAMQCGRRMFLAALMLASKFLQDRNYSTRAWGKITGLPTSEINTNELKFLEAVDWKLHVSKEKFERWSHTVIILSAAPKPGISKFPQPSLVETVGWRAVLERLTPDCLDDFSQFRDGSLPSSLCYQPDLNGMLTPPSSPPDSTSSDQEESSDQLNTRSDQSNIETVIESSSTCLAPPPAPHQQNLPTPGNTPSLSQCSSSMSRVLRGAPRCRESASAMAALKLCARPATRTLCPPPTQKPCENPDQLVRPTISRRTSASSSTSTVSSPESVRSDVSDFPGRSRSSSISSVGSSIVLPFEGILTSQLPLSRDLLLPSCHQHYTNLSKIDCSSTLRPEEYSAADALLRFYQHRDIEASNEQDGGETNDLTKTELITRSKQSLHLIQSTGSAEKKKKKRTHSKTNIPDILNVGENDLQSLVRKQLMNSRGENSDIVTPDTNVSEIAGRQYKRTRSTRDQSSAVDLTRKLMRGKNKENRPSSSHCRGSSSSHTESLARCSGKY